MLKNNDVSKKVRGLLVDFASPKFGDAVNDEAVSQ